MYALAFLSVVLAVVGSVTSLVIPRNQPPAGWLTDILQSYDDYHARYLALDCEAKHNTTFFDQCCHPLLKNEPISALPAQCNPANVAKTTTAPAAIETSEPDCSDDDDGEDGDTETEEPTSTATPTPTPSSEPDCSDDDGDDGETETDEPTSTATPTPTPTPAPSSSKKSTSVKSTSTTTSSSSSKATSSKATSTQKSSSAAPAKTPAANVGSAPSSSDSQVFTDGVATFFFQNGVAGACGTVHPDSAVIAAIDQARYGDPGKVSDLCGKQVVITNQKNGKTVTVTIADDCPTCDNADSIDLSVGAFTQIATEEEGEVPISWHFA